MDVRLSTVSGGLAGLLTVLVAGCGAHSAPPTRTSVAAAASTVGNPQPPVAHLRILAPRPGSRTGSTVLVRVRLTGGGSPGHRPFRYRLDGRPAVPAGARLTVRHLPPGRHRLSVTFADGAHAAATVSFIVRPLVPPAAATVEGSKTAAATTTAPPPATTTTSAPATPATPATPTPPGTPSPPATPTTPARPTTTARAPTTPSPPANGIPQNNGGDQDADNNGGPTDGDGNI
jgi:hypothetical protein